MMCSKEKATFGPIFDQVLQALINTLGPQCFDVFDLIIVHHEIGLNREKTFVVNVGNVTCLVILKSLTVRIDSDSFGCPGRIEMALFEHKFAR